MSRAGAKICGLTTSEAVAAALEGGASYLGFVLFDKSPRRIGAEAAAWATDSLTLYVSAYSLEISLVNQQRSHSDGSWVVSRDELLRRYAALPGTFSHSKRYAAELTAGTGHDRFDFTIGLMIDGLAHR